MLENTGIKTPVYGDGGNILYQYLNVKAYIIGIHVVFRSIYLYINCHQTATKKHLLI